MVLEQQVLAIPEEPLSLFHLSADGLKLPLVAAGHCKGRVGLGIRIFPARYGSTIFSQWKLIVKLSLLAPSHVPLNQLEVSPSGAGFSTGVE
jgi:hypothetical protein